MKDIYFYLMICIFIIAIAFYLFDAPSVIIYFASFIYILGFILLLIIKKMEK